MNNVKTFQIQAVIPRFKGAFQCENFKQSAFLEFY